MYEPIDFIDMHMHAESRSFEDLSKLYLAGCRGGLAVSGPGGGYSTAEGLADHFRRLDVLERKRLEDAGIHPWIAVGAHPAGIPEQGLDWFLDNWAELARRFNASAIGEVGLFKGGEQEELVLARAFEVAKETGLVVVMHTPVDRKLQALERSLQLLAHSGLDAMQVIADHLTRETLPLAKNAGCHLGLSVHPVKLSPEQASQLVDEFGPDRIVLNSDMGASPSHLFAIPASISAMRDMALDEQTIRTVVFSNAAAIMGMKP